MVYGDVMLWAVGLLSLFLWVIGVAADSPNYWHILLGIGITCITAALIREQREKRRQDGVDPP